MEFFKHLWNSLWNIDWMYKMKKNKKKSWLYFILFMFILVLVQFGPFLYQLPKVIDQGKDLVVNHVPEFTATFEGGELAVTELEQPYIFVNSQEGDEFLVYVDTSSTEPLNLRDLLEEHESNMGILVTKESFEMYDPDEGQSRTQDFRDMPDVSFDKSDVVAGIEKWAGMVGVVAIIVIMLIVFVFWTIGKLIYLLILSLITLAIAEASRKKWKYSDIFTLGLTTMILPSVLLAASVLLFKSKPPFAYSIIFYVVTLTVVFKHPGKGHKKHHHKDEEEPKEKK